MAGLDSTGLTILSTEEIRDELNADVRSAFGTSLNTDDGTVIGTFLGIIAERLGILWELAETVYSSQDPDKATGASLEAICGLTNTTRKPQTFSKVNLTQFLTGTPTTNVPAGSIVRTASTKAEFTTDNTSILTTATAWAPSTAYLAGTIITNASRIYTCITSGTSAGSGGPTTTAEDILDGTVHWRFIGDGTGFGFVAATAVLPGPTIALSGDIIEIVTPVGGWQSTKNLTDAAVGSFQESEPDLRIRRLTEVSGIGASTYGALLTAIDRVADVTDVSLYVNEGEVTDGDGLPPKSFEAVVTGGTDAAVSNAILIAKPAGIKSFGTTSQNRTDQFGKSHVINFSRPQAVDIYVHVVAIKDPTSFPVDGSTQIELAIINYGDAQKPGKDVVASVISAQVHTVTGILKVVSIGISTSPITPPGPSADIVINNRQLAVFDTSRITVALSDGTP